MVEAVKGAVATNEVNDYGYHCATPMDPPERFRAYYLN